MISRKELKMAAKEALRGKWAFSVALVLIIFLLPSVLNIIPFLGAIAVLVLTPAISYVPQEIFLKVKRNDDVKIGNALSALFSKLGSYWGIVIRTFLKLLPWFLLMLVGSFLTVSATTSRFMYNDLSSSMISPTTATLTISSIYSLLGSILFIVGYALTFTNSLFYLLAIYVKTDNPSMTCKEAVLKSRELMTGHRIEYFILSLSFIGWALVGAFTFGIGLFYVIPYMYTTFAAFYDELAGIKNYTEENNNEVIQF
ncbi:MAG: DUF975 family protein [Clostridiales bacterium]|nr:DUF975 family protein [Clostridiales bacterium]